MSEMTIITDALFASFGGDLATLEGYSINTFQKFIANLEKHGSTSSSKIHSKFILNMAPPPFNLIFISLC